MKWFWILIALLVLATGALFAVRQRPSAPPLEGQSVPSEPEAFTHAPPATTPAPEHAAPIEPPAAPPAPAEHPPASTTATVDRALDQPEKPTPALASATPEPIDLPATPPIEAKAEPLAPDPAASETPGTPTDAPSTSDAPQAIDESTQPAAQQALFRDQFEIAPARVKLGDNGFTIYDERFPVKGAGTPEDPVEVSWDLLVSASETFQPRMGKKRLPERITMLDGKHVRITGYVAFPIMAAAQNEMLSMRNMWDGCCIGVPPTPYDAIEVKLKAAATGRDRFTSFGTIEGLMQVDPYIKGNWLLGLYLIEGAKLSQLKEGADPTRHGGM